MLPVKNRFPNCDFRGGQISQPLVLWLIHIYIDRYIYLGAGKHPSPLDISESYSPDLYLKVGFYLIKKYCSCPKLSQFKDRAILWLVPAPIYTCCDVSDDIHTYTYIETYSGPGKGPAPLFIFWVFFFFFFCQGLYIGTLKCRGSIIVYIHTYIHTYRYTYIYIDNFHPFCNPYIEISIKGGAFWDYRFFRSQSKLCIRLG